MQHQTVSTFGWRIVQVGQATKGNWQRLVHVFLSETLQALDKASQQATSKVERDCLTTLIENPRSVAEAADNLIEIPNDAKSAEMIQAIMGEYREWMSATKIAVVMKAKVGYERDAPLVSYCQSVAKMQSGSFSGPQYKVYVDVWAEHGRRIVKIDGDRAMRWGPDVEIAFSTKGQLRSAIEHVWMTYSVFLG